MTTIIDYGTGNLRSVANALARLGEPYEITSDPAAVAVASRVILPGVGEASTAIRSLSDRGLAEAVRSLKAPVLGICIGMQLMCRRSEEGAAECLGIFDADVRMLRAKPGMKIPHMGWDTIEKLSGPLFDGIDNGTYVYYVHSFAPEPSPQAIAVTAYGTYFTAALQSGNFHGVQFHPEKSGAAGARILSNFLKL